MQRKIFQYGNGHLHFILRPRDQFGKARFSYGSSKKAVTYSV